MYVLRYSFVGSCSFAVVLTAWLAAPTWMAHRQASWRGLLHRLPLPILRDRRLHLSVPLCERCSYTRRADVRLNPIRTDRHTHRRAVRSIRAVYCLPSLPGVHSLYKGQDRQGTALMSLL